MSRRLLDGETMSDVCREVGISRKTGYKIFDRYREHGLEAPWALFWWRLEAQRSRFAPAQLQKAEDAAAGYVERRLAAILAADVAGYSRLVSADEPGTLVLWRAHWDELIEPKIGEHQGRVVSDGILAEFASVVNAVRCAVAQFLSRSQARSTSSSTNASTRD
jgi:class 3 adenylate cyclase